MTGTYQIFALILFSIASLCQPVHLLCKQGSKLLRAGYPRRPLWANLAALTARSGPKGRKPARRTSRVTLYEIRSYSPTTWMQATCDQPAHSPQRFVPFVRGFPSPVLWPLPVFGVLHRAACTEERL